MEYRTTRPRDGLRACRIRRYVVLLAVLALLAGRPVIAQTDTAQVDRVIDGDTIRVRLDGARYTVHLTGVDTPETTHPTRGVEPDGPEAANDTTARLTGATVRLDLDPAGDDTDASGRLVRYVVLASGENFNATLIREGYATPPSSGPTSGMLLRVTCLPNDVVIADTGMWARDLAPICGGIPRVPEVSEHVRETTPDSE